MSSPQATVGAVHSPAPMKTLSIGSCPTCKTQAPKGGWRVNTKCPKCGRTLTAPKTKQLAEAFAPIRLGEAGDDGKRRSWIMYMPLGTFHHPEYGDLKFTHKLLGEVKQNFDEHTRGIEIALDEDHGSSRDNTAATGWIERMEFRDAHGDDAAGLWAYVRWTPLGVEDIQTEKYKYFSPEYGNHLNELTGDKIANVPFGGGLTNRPFLKVMPAVKLAQRGVPAGAVAPRALTRLGDAALQKGTTMATQKLMGKPLRQADDEEAPEMAEDTQTYDDGDEYAEGDNEDLADNGDDEEAEEEAPPPKKKATKKMSEYAGMSTTQLAERLIEVERQQQLTLAEKAVDSQIAAWQSGTFKFNETKGRTMAKVTLSRVFEEAYRSLMLSDEAFSLSEGTQRQVQKVIELALTRAIVPLGSVAKSGYDTPRTRDTKPRASSSQETQELALVEAARSLAEGDGKQWDTLSFNDQAAYQLRAERQVTYFTER